MDKKKIGVSLGFVSLLTLSLTTLNKDTLANILKDKPNNYVGKNSTYSEKKIDKNFKGENSSEIKKVNNLELISLALKNIDKIESENNIVEIASEPFINEYISLEKEEVTKKDIIVDNNINEKKIEETIVIDEESSLSSVNVDKKEIEENNFIQEKLEEEIATQELEEENEDSQEKLDSIEDSSDLSNTDSSPQVNSSELKVIELPIEGWLTHNLNVRSNPQIGENIIGVLNIGTKVSGVESNGWVKIDFNGKTSYISRDYISLTEIIIEKEEEKNIETSKPTESTKPTENETENKEVSTNANNITGWIKSAVNFRTKPSTGTDSSVISVLAKGTKVSGVESNGWVKINYEGKEGYVAKSYISDSEIKNESTNTNTENKESTNHNNVKPESSSSDVINKIVSDAYSFLGSKYTWAGSTPSTGFDCSGLVYYLYKTHAGITLNRNSAAQASNGYKVSLANIKSGDLLFFSNSGSTINHVGLYVGNGKMIHASNPEQGVRMDNVLDGYYAKTFVTARRIID